MLAQIGLINASLKITRGEKPAFSDLWTPQHFWQFIFVSILYGLGVGFGLILCIIPGLLVIWAWQFAQYSALNSGPGIFASFGESWRMVSANKGPAVITLLVLFVASIVTLITCGIGALVVAPFSTLFMANMFRQFRRSRSRPDLSQSRLDPGPRRGGPERRWVRGHPSLRRSAPQRCALR